MRTIEAESETRLPALLEHVEQGETILITRKGRTIARLVPDSDGRLAEVGRVLAEIEIFRKTMPQLTIDEILSARHEGHERWMPFVVDASVTISWLMPDERDKIAQAAWTKIAQEAAIVPAVWWFEVRNALIVGERRGRLDGQNTVGALRLLTSLPIPRYGNRRRTSHAPRANLPPDRLRRRISRAGRTQTKATCHPRQRSESRGGSRTYCVNWFSGVGV